MARKLKVLTQNEFLDSFIEEALRLTEEKFVSIDNAKRQRILRALMDTYTSDIGVPEVFLSRLKTLRNPKETARQTFRALSSSAQRITVVTKPNEFSKDSFVRLASIRIAEYFVTAALGTIPPPEEPEYSPPWAPCSNLQADLKELFTFLRNREHYHEIMASKTESVSAGQNGTAPDEAEGDDGVPNIRIPFHAQEKQWLMERFENALFSVTVLIQEHEPKTEHANGKGQYL